MVVEPDLPDRRATRIGEKRLEACPAGLVERRRVVGMHAHRRVDEWCVALRKLERRLGRREIPAGDQNALDTRGRGALDDGVAIGVEARVLQMGVRVDDPGKPLRNTATGQTGASSSMRGKIGTGVPVGPPDVSPPHARS